MHLHNRAGTPASLLYKAEKPSVCLSIRLHHADNSVMSASIEMGLFEMKGTYVVGENKVYFLKLT